MTLIQVVGQLLLFCSVSSSVGLIRLVRYRLIESLTSRRVIIALMNLFVLLAPLVPVPPLPSSNHQFQLLLPIHPPITDYDSVNTTRVHTLDVLSAFSLDLFILQPHNSLKTGARLPNSFLVKVFRSFSFVEAP